MPKMTKEATAPPAGVTGLSLEQLLRLARITLLHLSSVMPIRVESWVLNFTSQVSIFRIRYFSIPTPLGGIKRHDPNIPKRLNVSNNLYRVVIF
jgi:hypothetical protein